MAMVTAAAAARMVARELAPAGIGDRRLQAALASIPRHLFLPAPLRGRAYSNLSLPIGLGQTISAPLTVAKSLCALGLSGGETVLDIGTGSGYQAAVLSQLCRAVYSVERLLPLVHRAKQVLSELNLGNVMVKYGDGSKGWVQHAPYDAIVSAAVFDRVPEAWGEQLRVGGRLVAPLRSRGQREHLLLMRRDRFGLRLVKDLGPCSFVPLIEETR
jgi:protein-L-isoaspartate(D-aspartate) O-methyltransferase